MTESEVLGLEVFGRELFGIAKNVTEGTSDARSEHEKEGLVVKIFERLEEMLIDSIPPHTEEQIKAIRKGANLACEEWVRPISEPSLPGVSA
jgi:hypothetical protein